MQIQRFSNKFDRSNFYIPSVNDETTLSNVLDYDLSNSYFYLFTSDPEKLRYYQLEREDSGRPDMISFKAYNQMDFWWIILKFNDIIDPFSELVEGVVLKIPQITEINTWYTKVKTHLDKDARDRTKQNKENELKQRR